MKLVEEKRLGLTVVRIYKPDLTEDERQRRRDSFQRALARALLSTVKK
jgi:hypothetical protein